MSDMMAHTFTRQQTLVTESCCSCFMVFAMTDEFQAKRRRDHAVWYCPAGHGQSYTGPSDEDRLRAQLAQSERRLASRADDLRVERLSHSATKGQLTKVRKRADAGVCQHCHRTFQNVSRHMATQHREASS